MENKIGKVYDGAIGAVDRVVSYANDNKGRLIKTLYNSILLLIVFALLGCFDFVNLSFHFEYLRKVAYWTKTITKTIAGVLCWNIGVNLSWDREIAKDNELRQNAKKYEELNKLKDQTTFNHYIVNVFNPKVKKEAYINSINNKLYRLNKWARNKDKLLWTNGSSEEKAKNRYCRKRGELEFLKSDEYIDNNLSSINVKYTEIDPIVFELELDGKQKSNGYKVTGNVASGRTKRSGSVILSMLTFSMIMSSIATDPSAEEFVSGVTYAVNTTITILSDIGVAVWKVFSGVLASRGIINEEITMPLVKRCEILQNYMNWCATEKIENSKAHMIMKTIEKVGAKNEEQN